jgi:hypothetical protein
MGDTRLVVGLLDADGVATYDVKQITNGTVS